MKLVALVLLLVVSAHAQTLKWSVPVPEFPEGTTSAVVSQIRSDSAGNVLLSNCYQKDAANNFQLLWVSSSGKLLHTAIVENASILRVLRVSGSTILVHAEGVGVSFFRKYTRKGTVVTLTDTPLPSGNGVALSQGEDFEDINKGFFFVIQREGGVIPRAIHRYNAR
jgi:hypothetical protein